MATRRNSFRAPLTMLCVLLMLAAAGCTAEGTIRDPEPPSQTGPDVRAGEPGIVGRPIDDVEVDPPHLDVTYRYGIPGCEEPAGVRIEYGSDEIRLTALSRRVAEPDQAECPGDDVESHTERIVLEEPLRARDIIDDTTARVLQERP